MARTLSVIIVGTLLLGHGAPAAQRITSEAGMSQTVVNRGAIAVIVAVAKEINSWLATQKAEKKTNEIITRLEAIENRLVVMQQDLKEALTYLKAIAVRVDAIPDEEARKRITSILTMICEDLPTWFSKPSQYKAVAQQRMDDLRREARNVTQRASYGNFHVVALAMLAENDLATFTKVSADQRKRYFKHYETYFHDALDPLLPESVANRRKALLDEAAALRAKHAALPRFEGALVCWKQVIYGCGGSSESQQCRYDWQYKVTGAIDGEPYERRELIYTNEKQCGASKECSGGEGCPTCIRMNTAEPSFFTTAVRSNVPTIDPVQANCPEWLNADRKAYLEAVAAEKVLAEAIKEVQALEKTAQTLQKTSS